MSKMGKCTETESWLMVARGWGKRREKGVTPKGSFCYWWELWELDHKEGRMPKNWWLQTMVLEKTPESPSDSKEIKPVNLKGDQPWIFTGRTDAEAEVPVFWSFDVDRRLTGKIPDAGEDWGQKEKRASEDEMAGQHYWCNEHELGQTLVDGEGQGGLACCRPWGHRVKHNWVTKQQQWWGGDENIV